MRDHSDSLSATSSSSMDDLAAALGVSGGTGSSRSGFVVPGDAHDADNSDDDDARGGFGSSLSSLAASLSTSDVQRSQRSQLNVPSSSSSSSSQHARTPAPQLDARALLGMPPPPQATTDKGGAEARRGRRVTATATATPTTQQQLSVGGDFKSFMNQLNSKRGGEEDAMAAQLASLGLQSGGNGTITGSMGTSEAMAMLGRGLNVLYRQHDTVASAPLLILLHENPTEDEAKLGVNAAQARASALGDDAIGTLHGAPWSIALPIGLERHVRAWGVVAHCWADPLASSMQPGAEAGVSIDGLTTLAELEDVAKRLQRSVGEAVKAHEMPRAAVMVAFGRAASAVAMLASLEAISGAPTIANMPPIAGCVLVSDSIPFASYAADRASHRGKKVPLILAPPRAAAASAAAGGLGTRELAEVGVAVGVIQGSTVGAACAAASALEEAHKRKQDMAIAFDAAGAVRVARVGGGGGWLADDIDIKPMSFNGL